MYGPDHPQAAIRASNLGTVLSDGGDPAAARPWFERALGIFEARLPAGHPNIEVVRRHLAALDGAGE